jgi:DNA-directed RNA polymerase specialized sigma24 family protein
MTECQSLVAAMRGGDDEKKEAMRKLYTDVHCQRMARRVYQNCSAGRRLFQWDDFFAEAIIRFVRAAASGRTIRSCANFFFGICRNYCSELTRQLREPEASLPEDNLNKDELLLLVQRYVDQLGPQCRLLLRMIYFDHERIDTKDRSRLVAELKKHGYTVQESSISATITNCKASLRRLIGDRLDDYFTD